MWVRPAFAGRPENLGRIPASPPFDSLRSLMVYDQEEQKESNALSGGVIAEIEGQIKSYHELKTLFVVPWVILS